MPTRRSIAAGLAVVLGLGVTLSASSSAAPPVLPVHERPITWTNQYGTASFEDWNGGPHLGRASNGDLYVAGATKGSFPGYVSSGGSDLFVSRFDKNGVHKWTFQFGSSEDDWVGGLAVTSGGDLYVVGGTDGDIDNVGPGPFGATDVFVSKWDKNGVHKWIRQIGTPEDDWAEGIANAGSSDVYIAGWTEGGIDGLGPAIGGADAFVSRFDRNGNQRWVRQFGSTEDDYLHAVAVRGTSEIYVGGRTSGDVDGPGPLDADPSFDGYLVRWDRNGNGVWQRTFGAGGQWDSVSALAVSSTTKLWVAGTTESLLDDTLPAPLGGSDAYASFWDRNGNSYWFTQWGSPAYDDVRAVAATSSTVYVTGYTDGDIDDMGPGVQQGAGDLYLTTMSTSNGALSTLRQFGTPGFEGFPYMVLTSSTYGRPVVAGITSGVVTGHANAGSSDVFLTQFG